MEEIAQNVAVIPMKIVNAYLVGDSRNWILVDTGTPGGIKDIREAVEARFGPHSSPRAIVLTHGHFDHAGTAEELSRLWDVKVYAHQLEWPFLTGKSPYPPMDPTGPGAFCTLSRLFPSRTANVSDRVADLSGALPALGFADWEAIETPGHTPGHVSLFRRSDTTLLAGDALTTVNLDNLLTLLTKKPQVCRPPIPATTDWQQAQTSLRTLALLRPRVIGAGHGTPMRDAAGQLENLAAHFPVPGYGRYAKQPAQFDENGIVWLPPAPPDYAPKIAAAVALVTAGAFLLSRRRQR